MISNNSSSKNKSTTRINSSQLLSMRSGTTMLENLLATQNQQTSREWKPHRVGRCRPAVLKRQGRGRSGRHPGASDRRSAPPQPPDLPREPPKIDQKQPNSIWLKNAALIFLGEEFSLQSQGRVSDKKKGKENALVNRDRREKDTTRNTTARLLQKDIRKKTERESSGSSEEIG